MGSKGKLAPDKTLEMGSYYHLFAADGSQTYFSIFCIPMRTVDSKGELVPDKTLEICVYQHLFGTILHACNGASVTQWL